MSGEFGENFKPNTKGVEGAKHEEAEEKHDPFADARALKGPDTSASDSKNDKAAAKTDDVQAATKKLYDQSYNEKEHGPYHEYLANKFSPEQNAAMFEKLINSAQSKINASAHFDATVADASQSQVANLMASFNKVVEEIKKNGGMA